MRLNCAFLATVQAAALVGGFAAVAEAIIKKTGLEKFFKRKDDGCFAGRGERPFEFFCNITDHRSRIIIMALTNNHSRAISPASQQQPAG